MKDTILENFEIRKSNREKTAFIEYIKTRLFTSGYDTEKDITIEQHGGGILRSRNIVIGDPSTADLILTAHYDTCAVLPFPNLMSPVNAGLFILSQILITFFIFAIAFGAAIVTGLITRDASLSVTVMLVFLYAFLFHMMFGYRNKHTANDNTSGVITITRILERLPLEHRKKVCAVYFDNEEKGLLGSSSFYKKHKKDVQNTLVLNFDCVGDGTNITFLAGKQTKQTTAYQTILRVMEETAHGHDVTFLDENMRFMMFPSDQMHFKHGVGICALHKSPFGMYVARIHTPFDTKCREENIFYLTHGILESISQLQQ